MDAARDGQKGEIPRPPATKKAEPAAQAGPGSAQESRRERAKGGAAHRANGTAPDGIGESKAPGADAIAHDVTTAVAEVSRAAVEVLHAAAEATVEVAQHALALAEEEVVSVVERPSDPTRVARRSLDRSFEAGVTFFELFAQSAEASLRAVLDIQTTALSAGLSMLDAANSTNREFARQWNSLAREAYGGAVAAWQANFQGVGAAEER